MPISKQDFFRMTEIIKDRLAILEEYAVPNKHAELETLSRRCVDGIREIITMFEDGVGFIEPEIDEGGEDHNSHWGGAGPDCTIGRLVTANEPLIMYEGDEFTMEYDDFKVISMFIRRKNSS